MRLLAQEGGWGYNYTLAGDGQEQGKEQGQGKGQRQGQRKEQGQEQGQGQEQMQEQEGILPILRPVSNSLTQTDREYFNIVQTEDGTSGFYRGKMARPPTNYPQDTAAPSPTPSFTSFIRSHSSSTTSSSPTSSSPSPSSTLYSSNSPSPLPSFQFHQTLQRDSNLPIVGLYLGRK